MEGVYKIENKINGKHYVGSSCDIEGRWEVHKWALERSDHINPHLQRAWNKYGKENFVFGLVDEILEGQEARLAREQVYLNKGFDQGVLYNVARKADCPPSRKGSHHTEEFKAGRSKANLGENNPFYGKRHTEESRRKNSKAHSGENNPNYGKRFSEEHRAKISQGNKGRKHSEEIRAKISKALVGRKLTEEVRAKMSRGRKGKNTKPYPSFYNERTGEFIPKGVGLRPMCIERGLKIGSIWKLKEGISKFTRDGWVLRRQDSDGLETTTKIKEL